MWKPRIFSLLLFDNTVIMWRTCDGFELWRQMLPQEIERVAWSPDGSMVASCSEDFLVRVFDAKTGDLLMKMKHNQGVDELAWSNNGKYLASGEEHSKDKDGNEQRFLKLSKMPMEKIYKKVNFRTTINSCIKRRRMYHINL